MTLQNCFVNLPRRATVLLLLLVLMVPANASAQSIPGMESHQPPWAAEIDAVEASLPTELTSIGDLGWSDWVSDQHELVRYRSRVSGGKLIIEMRHDKERLGHTYAMDNADLGGIGVDTSVTIDGEPTETSAWTQHGHMDLSYSGMTSFGFAGRAFLTRELETEADSVKVAVSGQVCDEGNCFDFSNLSMSAPVHRGGDSQADATSLPQTDASGWSDWQSAGGRLVSYRVKLTEDRLFVEAWHDHRESAHTFALGNRERLGGEAAPMVISVSGAQVGEWEGPQAQDFSDFTSKTINYGYAGRVLFGAPLIGVDEALVDIEITGAVQAQDDADPSAIALSFEVDAPPRALAEGQWSYWLTGPDDLVAFRARVKGGALHVQAQHDEERKAHTYAFNNLERGGISGNLSFTVSGAEIGEWKTDPVEDLTDPEFPEYPDYGWSGEANFSAPIKSREGALSLTIAGQVCDATGCLLFGEGEQYPALSISLGSADAGSQGAGGANRQTEAAGDEAEGHAARLRIAENGSVVMNPFGGTSIDALQGWLEFILFAIAGGLFALLMPCVYPMIPITVSFFGKQAEASGKPTTLLALVYGFGLMATYTALGFILSSLGSVNAFGGNPWVASAIGVFFLVFAMSMLGMFELRLPYGVAQKFNMQGKAQGTVGALTLGLTFAVTSMACTVPVVGMILAGSADGEFWRPLIGMLVYSGTVALPFVLLGMAPGLVKRLPRAGGWMNSVKMIFGFVELAAAAEFFGWARLISRETVLAIWVACAVLSAFYLLGLFRAKHDVETGGLSGLRILFATLFLSMGLWVSTGLFGGSLGYIESFLINESSSEWQENVDLKQALKQAKNEGKPVFIDFTGSNCTNCRRFEQAVLEKDWAKDQLESFVKLRLYTDNDEYGESYNAFTKKLFNFIGQPQYAIVNSKGEITAWTPDINLVLQHSEESKRQEAFQTFLDTANAPGYAFTFADGFAVPEDVRAQLEVAGD